MGNGRPYRRISGDDFEMERPIFCGALASFSLHAHLHSQSGPATIDALSQGKRREEKRGPDRRSGERGKAPECHLGLYLQSTSATRNKWILDSVSVELISGV